MSGSEARKDAYRWAKRFVALTAVWLFFMFIFFFSEDRFYLGLCSGLGLGRLICMAADVIWDSEVKT